MRFHIIHDDSCANGKHFTAIIVSDEVVLHLVLQNAGCIACLPVQWGSTNSRCFSFHFDEQSIGMMVTEVTILSWMFIVITNDESVEISDGRYRRGRHY